MEKMDKYNDDLSETRVRVIVQGLHPISDIMRFTFENPSKNPVITYGPFLESK